jgi:hypothetical protein
MEAMRLVEEVRGRCTGTAEHRPSN